jgi:Bacterial Ig domain
MVGRPVRAADPMPIGDTMRLRRLAATAVVAISLSVLPSTVLAASPIAGNDQVAMNEDESVTIDVLRNDSDPDGDALHIQSITQGLDGTATLAAAAGFITFVPRLNFNGPATFSYTVADTTGATATAMVVVFVSRVNDPPVAADRVATVAEDGSVSVLFQALDPDKEGCDLVFIAEPNTAFGHLSAFTDAGCNANGDMATATYVPLPGYNGPDTITYLVSDGTIQSNFATVSVTVTPVDDAPVAFAGSASTASGTPVSITVRGYDWETCELGFSIAGQPAHGTLSAIGAAPCGPGGPLDQNVDSASIVYTPAAGFSGPDSLSFTVTDGTTVSSPATISISVVAPPSVHVGDLDATTVKGSGTWQTSVTVRIHTSGHASQPGAVVTGVWGTGAASTCITTITGTCSVASGPLARKIQSTTFRVTSVTAGSAVYDATANHDPDSDSTGSSIVISRP